MDGVVVIGAELETKNFEAQIKKLENDINHVMQSVDDNDNPTGPSLRIRTPFLNR